MKKQVVSTHIENGKAYTAAAIRAALRTDSVVLIQFQDASIDVVVRPSGPLMSWLQLHDKFINAIH